MKVHKAEVFDENKTSYIAFLGKKQEVLGDVFGCGKLCNRKDKHWAYDAFVVKRYFNDEVRYHICAHTSSDRHVFDMILAKKKDSEGYVILIFKSGLDCIFMNDEDFANNVFCCAFPGDELFKMLQKQNMLEFLFKLDT